MLPQGSVISQAASPKSVDTATPGLRQGSPPAAKLTTSVTTGAAVEKARRQSAGFRPDGENNCQRACSRRVAYILTSSTAGLPARTASMAVLMATFTSDGCSTFRPYP